MKIKDVQNGPPRYGSPCYVELREAERSGNPSWSGTPSARAGGAGQVVSYGSDQLQLFCAALDAQNSDQVAFDRVHDPVRADAQPQQLAPPERLRRVRVLGQLSDCNSNGAHPCLISHEAACRRPCRRQPLDPH